MFCTECGAKATDTDKFCFSCGKALRDALKTLPESSLNQTDEKYLNDAAMRKYSKLRLAATIGLCVVLSLVVNAVSFVYVLRKTFSEQNIVNIFSEIDVVQLADDLGVYDELVDALAGDVIDKDEDADEDE